MWSYIESRLAAMPQIFLGLDFVQVLNPLYALPIVAVVVCAFLVYAFGFKSPVQPPSFDEIIERKTSKRRKIKENQKCKQQNGKIIGTAARGSENAAEKKKKVDKTPTEKTEPMVESKAVKKTNVIEKKKNHCSSQKVAPVVEDTTDALDGWVHLVSKKGRKNRKKDDVSSCIYMQPIATYSNMLEISNNIAEVCVNAESSVEDDNKQAIDISSIHENDSVKLVTKEAKATRKKNDLVKKDVYNASAEEQKFEQKVGVENDLDSEVVGVTGMAGKEKKATRKKKKKNGPAEKEVDILSEMAPVDVSYSNFASNNSTNVELSCVTSEKVIGEKPLSCPEVPVIATGSNVMFDELEDLYPDIKPLKKKKKVRRDH